MNRSRLLAALMVLALAAAPILAQRSAPQAVNGLITLETLSTFGARSLGEVQWQDDGSGYFMLEPSAKQGLSDITRYDASTGQKTILVSADKLTPQGASSPISIEQFDFSQNGQKLLIFANSQRVWRSNTRGDYWVLDLKDWKLRKLGGDAGPSMLMFAKFSPDGARVGYVRENNLYVEGLSD